jgi:sortase A
MKRLLRTSGTLLIVAGVLTLAWAVTVWRWQDPFTAALNAYEQRELAASFDRRLGETASARPADASPAAGRDAIERAASSWRKTSERGDAVARIRIPRIGLSAVVVNGTDHESLKRGPGHYLGSAMPGEGRLVYLAGHRTTYGAPFSRIDHLRKGDRIFLELPYGTFEYAVTGHRIVAASQTEVLRSKGYEQLALQACHPRFFATHRLIAYAKPVRFTAPQRSGDGSPLAAAG